MGSNTLPATIAMPNGIKRTETGYPDFFMLGAAKCGTTSLHAWLDFHPDILMSNPTAGKNTA